MTILVVEVPKFASVFLSALFMQGRANDNFERNFTGIAIQFLTMKWGKKLRDHIVMVPCGGGGGDAGALCDIVYMLDLW